jgi:hypothetical protein
VLGTGANSSDAPGHDQHRIRGGQTAHQRPQRDADVAQAENLATGDEGRQEAVCALTDAVDGPGDRREHAHLHIAHAKLGHDVGPQHGHHLILEMIDGMRDVTQMQHEILFMLAGFRFFFHRG